MQLPVTNFAWATKVNLTIRRIPGATDDGTGDTYVMAGASAADNQLIEDLWTHTQAQTPVPARHCGSCLRRGRRREVEGGAAEQFPAAETNLATYWRAPRRHDG